MQTNEDISNLAHARTNTFAHARAQCVLFEFEEPEVRNAVVGERKWIENEISSS